MEEVKYIQGDLVKLNGKTVKITFAGHDVIEYIPLDRRGGDEWRTSRKLIEPIPLTPEILVKNGWKNDGYDWYKLPTKRAYLYITKDITTFGEFLVCVGLDRHNLASINFVHQLQHILFSLNINHKMEV